MSEEKARYSEEIALVQALMPFVKDEKRSVAEKIVKILRMMEMMEEDV